MALPDKYPILEYDTSNHAVIDPVHLVKPMPVPENCVLTFFREQLQKLHQKGKTQIIKKLRSEMGSHLVYSMKTGSSEIALCHPGVGAPLAAALFEELIAMGCRNFIACGSAGVLNSEITMGELLIPTTALRDEGTSYHYLPPAREVAASSEAVETMVKILRSHNKPHRLTKTWTTDAIFRETRAKIRLRRSEGCDCVEMEAAALFAVAAFRKVNIGMLLYGGDDLGGQKWQSRGWMVNSEIRSQLLELAIESCQEL